MCFVFFFFFQAEDGIRDKLVTGVQTCALPISSWSRGPTVTLVPWTSSDRIGNNVPHSTENAIPMNSRLLNRKLASRLTIDSSCASAKSSGSRLAYSAKLAVPITIRNARKKYPTLDWVNECTLEITPERVMNVPKIDKSHDPMIRARFHFFNIPRFS